MNGTAQSQKPPQQAQAPRRDGGEHGYITPPANISATDSEYLVEVDMPGVDKDGLEITVEGNELSIIGRRKSDLPQGEVCYCESPLADYRRMFELGPDVDTSKISAEMQQGVLKLHLPKSETAKPRHIEVKVA
jgi:HSP20 family protein